MTLWYNTGTVAVTNGSTNLTGTGTAWGSGNVAPGDAFIGPDGRPYPIASITSDTAMVLQVAYDASTASGQSYVIQPTRAFTASAVQTVQSFLSAISAYQDGPLSGRFGDGSEALPGMAFLSQPSLGFRKVASNAMAFAAAGADRLRFSNAGVQVNVPVTGTAVQQSSTDFGAGRLARADWVYGPGNVLGIVSHVAGVPTGGLIEIGGNANGKYVRFAGGFQYCWGRIGPASNARTAQTFPAAFSGATADVEIGFTAERGVDGDYVKAMLRSNTLTGFEFQTDSFGGGHSLRWHAAGNS